MSQVRHDSADDEARGDRSRRRQNRINAEIQAADAQKLAAESAVKNTRYLLWSVMLATLSTLICAASTVYVVWANVHHLPQ